MPLFQMGIASFPTLILLITKIKWATNVAYFVNCSSWTRTSNLRINSALFYHWTMEQCWSGISPDQKSTWKKLWVRLITIIRGIKVIPMLVARIELATSCLQDRRSTTELNQQSDMSNLLSDMPNRKDVTKMNFFGLGLCSQSQLQESNLRL